MLDLLDAVLPKIRYFFVGVLVITSVFLLSIMLSRSSSVFSGEYSTNSPGTNIVAESFVELGKEVADATRQTRHATVEAAKTAGSAIAQAGKFVWRIIYTGLIHTGRGIQKTLAFSGQCIYNILSFAGRSISKTFSLIIESPAVSAAIRPDSDSQIPVIKTDFTSLTPLQTEDKALATDSDIGGTADNGKTNWPIHGRITAGFGVPHWPFQPRHTGIDISSGHGSGITQVFPYRSGLVIETVYSDSGLGNHIVVDHGNGLTSVYAHLYKISAVVGQEVTPADVLGLEGTTGMSTGTHLHFEIRLNGQPVDPGQYVPGQP